MDDEKEAGEIDTSDSEDVALTSGNPNGASLHGGVFERMQHEAKLYNKANDDLNQITPRLYRSPSSDFSLSENSDSDDEGVSLSKRGRFEQQNPPKKDSKSSVSSTCQVINTWGNILTEQTLSSFTSFNVFKTHSHGDRSVESYDYKSARFDERSDHFDLEFGEQPETCGAQYGDLDADTVNVDLADIESFGTSIRYKQKPKTKRKRPIIKCDFPKSHECIGISVDDGENKVVEKLAGLLKERNINLLEKIVKRIGTERALRIFYATQELEEAGGMMTMDGSRRRTPGGVFIQLLKTDPDTKREDIRAIFFDQNQTKKHSRKRKLKEKMQVAEPEMHDINEDCNSVNDVDINCSQMSIPNEISGQIEIT